VNLLSNVEVVVVEAVVVYPLVMVAVVVAVVGAVVGAVVVEVDHPLLPFLVPLLRNNVVRGVPHNNKQNQTWRLLNQVHWKVMEALEVVIMAIIYLKHHRWIHTTIQH
jgi:hypothetical protein